MISFFYRNHGFINIKQEKDENIYFKDSFNC